MLDTRGWDLEDDSDREVPVWEPVGRWKRSEAVNLDDRPLKLGSLGGRDGLRDVFDLLDN